MPIHAEGDSNRESAVARAASRTSEAARSAAAPPPGRPPCPSATATRSARSSDTWWPCATTSWLMSPAPGSVKVVIVLPGKPHFAPAAAQHLVQRARATSVRCTNQTRCARSAATGSCAALDLPDDIASPISNCCMVSPSTPARSHHSVPSATGFDLPPHPLAEEGFDFRPESSAAEGFFDPFAGGHRAVAEPEACPQVHAHLDD
jgi:hypothetical protein